MASDKIDFEDIFGKDFNKKLDDTIKGFEDLLELNSKMLKQSKKEPKTAENIERITKSVKDSKEAIQGLSEVEKQRIKLQKKLKDLNSDSIQQNEELKVQISEQNKSNKLLAKEKLNLIDTYSKESARLNKLRKQYKNLILEQGKGAKGAAKLEKEISELDKTLKDVDASAGQFQRNVGDYPATLGDATKSILALAAAGGVAKAAFDGVKGALENSAEGSAELEDASAGLGAAVDVAGNAVSSFFLDNLNYVKSAVKAYNETDNLADAQKQLAKEVAKNGGVFVKTSEATDNFGQKLEDAYDGAVELTQATRAWADEIRPLEAQIIRLNGKIAEQQVIAGDGTRSFAEINEAILEGQRLQIKSAEISIKIAKEEKKLIDEKLKLAEDANLRTVELLDQQAEAANKVTEAQIALNIELFENEKEIRQVKQDLLEKDLDILIDGFDNQKTINERKINDERKTLEEKRKIFNETKVLADESFEAQKRTLAELTPDEVNVDELLKLGSVELNERIRLLGLSEIIEGRLLEVIRERRIVLQDNEDIERDLFDIKKQSLDNIALSEQSIEQENFDFKKELLDKELQNVKTTAERKKEIEEEVFGTAKEQINDQAAFDKELAEKEIIDAEEKAKKLEEIENKRINDIKRLELDRIDAIEQAEIDALKERRDAIFDFVKQVSDITQDELDKRFDKVNKANEDEIDEREENIEKQQSLAEKGLDNQLAFEEKKRKEAQLKEIEDLEKQQKTKERIALAEAFMAAFEARLNDPKTQSGQAGFLALQDVLVAKSIGSALAGFEEGGYTSDVGTSTIAGVVHGQEFVIDAATTKKMGLKGSNMSDFKNKMFSGQLFNHDFITSDMSKTQIEGNARVVSAVESLENTIKSQPIQQVNVDGLGNLIEIVYKNGNKTKTTRKNPFK